MSKTEADLLTCALDDLTIFELTILIPLLQRQTSINTLGNIPNVSNGTVLIILCARNKESCFDVGVTCSTDCQTDHKILCAGIRMNTPHKPSASKITLKYAISSLKDTVREKYNNMVVREVSQDWKQEDIGDKKWEIFRKGVNNVAEEKRNRTD